MNKVGKPTDKQVRPVIVDHATVWRLREIREFVRRDFASVRQQPENDGEVVANNISSLLQRVSGSSVQEIERLIGELQTLRDMLHSEGARVQREIIQYANLSQAAMQSTKTIAEGLTNWKAVPGVPSAGE